MLEDFSKITKPSVKKKLFLLQYFFSANYIVLLETREKFFMVGKENAYKIFLL